MTDSQYGRSRQPTSPGAKRGQPIGYLLKDGHIGVAAEQKSVRNFKTGGAKRAYYLEGSPGVMGWLLGALAEEDVSRMTNEYVQNAAFAFIDSAAASRGGVLAPLKELVVRLIAEASHVMLPDIPPAYIEEIDGIVEGCRSANPWTQVRRESLLALNLGFDYLLAHIYSGKLFAARGYGAGLLKTPLGCNAFSLSGAAAGGRHFFGRDFMFPTANVLQDTACLIIYRPEAAAGQPPIAFVSQTAPGIVGSMVGVNARGLAMGVDMLPSRFCNPDRPGLIPCSLSGIACRRAVRPGRRWRMSLKRRAVFPGCTRWPMQGARRTSSRPVPACLREMSFRTPRMSRAITAGGSRRSRTSRWCGASTVHLRLTKGSWCAAATTISHRILSTTGTSNYGAHSIEAWSGNSPTPWWISSKASRMRSRERPEPLENAERRDRKVQPGRRVVRVLFCRARLYQSDLDGHQLPGPFYFAPQRESRPDVLVATNHCITPEMRLAGMNEWTAILVSGTLNDFQWRYDELTREILDALDAAPSEWTSRLP